MDLGLSVRDSEEQIVALTEPFTGTRVVAVITEPFQGARIRGFHVELLPSQT